MEDTKQKEAIGLFDLDGTLADHDKAIIRDLESIRSPEEPQTLPRYDDDAPECYKNRKYLIRSQPGWWFRLEPLALGFDVLAVSQQIGFKTHVLTKGPWTSENAWTEKYQWVKKYIGPDTDISVTTDKGISYGSFLVDDYPEYALRWLKWRPRGWVIMPVNCRNTEFTHPQVIKYDGTNIEEVRDCLEEIMARILAVSNLEAISRTMKAAKVSS